MQFGIVFWGILWINSKYNVKLLLLFLCFLVTSGYEMHNRNYHSLFEMLGAIPPASMMLYMYKFLLKKRYEITYINIYSIAFQLAILSFLKSPCMNYKFDWLWLNIGANLGFMITSLKSHDERKINYIQEILYKMTKFSFYILLGILITECAVFFAVISKYKNTSLFFICGIVLPVMLNLTPKLYQKTNE
jgi:hypothetical protein